MEEEEEEEGPVCEGEPEQLTCGIQIQGLSKVSDGARNVSASSPLLVPDLLGWVWQQGQGTKETQPEHV